MATVSGRVIFDRTRSAAVTSGDLGLANIPVVLQNVSTGARLTVLTDAAGNYTFLNVPDGSYRLVEAYGASDGVPTPGNFFNAKVGSMAQGGDPPITAAPNPPPGANRLDSLTPNTLLVTVSGSDLTNQNFLDGPVIYTPIQTILDPCAAVSGENLIDAADGGTFGTFPAGTPANTGAPTEPYPGVTPDFTYVLPNPAIFAPFGGEYTVQNIMNNSLSNQSGLWWRIVDHTAGDETGRMMVVNGDNPGAVFFRDTVAVRPNTDYLFTAWILNLFRVAGYPDPELGVRVLDQDGGVLYSDTLGALIPPNVNAPEWKEIGSVLNSQSNTSLTVEFVSEGPEVNGNDYAIDDISLHEIRVPQLVPVKTVDRQTAGVGETVRYTVTLTNPCQSPLTSVFFQDSIPTGLSFVPGSVSVNGTAVPGADPNAGFTLPDVPGGGTVTVSFSAVVDEVPTPNPALNSASIRYSYTPVEGGIPGEFDVVTNEVPVEVEALADLSVVKTASPDPVRPGDTLTYTITVSNAGPAPAESVVLTDNIPTSLTNAEVSTDGGATWSPWSSPYALGRLPSGQSGTILIRGTVAASAAGTIVNTAVVSSATPDPNPADNTSTTTTGVAAAFADIAVTKSVRPAVAVPGQTLIYAVTVTNNGPDAAEDATLYDEIPPELSRAEFSVDGGVTWNAWTNPYSLGRLAAGQSITILIRAAVSPSSCGMISNTAVASSATPDPDPNNNTATADTPISSGGADLSIEKTAFPNPAYRCQCVTFTLTVSNAGPAAAERVVITDSLPPELCWAVYSTDHCRTWHDWTGSYTVGTLPAGASASIQVSGFVSACAGSCICNTARVSSMTNDPNPSNNTAHVFVTVQEASCCLTKGKGGRA